MKVRRRTLEAISFVSILSAALCLWTQGDFRQNPLQDYEILKKVTVAANQAWTDSGLDVLKGQEFYFLAEGTISLQKDNPIADCGPEGLSMKTRQQPVPDQNLGALIGKILEKVEVITDKQTGEKTQKEVGQEFFIGKENKIALPIDGRLLLGINELVVGDNTGHFEVTLHRKK